jgi:hypothetical protein
LLRLSAGSPGLTGQFTVFAAQSPGAWVMLSFASKVAVCFALPLSASMLVGSIFVPRLPGEE